MGKRPATGATAQRFVETTLDLIAESGGSNRVNLRQIARRMGCAHTNVYNYFGDYPQLLWAAFHRTLMIYGDWLTKDLDDALPRSEYLHRLVGNLATFPQAHPGLYRFIASDQMPTPDIPPDILDTVSRMKTWLSSSLRAVSEPAIDEPQATEIADIVLAYVDGETLNLINRRLVPGEDVAGRIVDNALRLHRVLVRDAARGRTSRPRPPTWADYPKLELPTLEKGA